MERARFGSNQSLIENSTTKIGRRSATPYSLPFPIGRPLANPEDDELGRTDWSNANETD
jgi:hypothetical protein